MKENKQTICDALAFTLHFTRNQYDIEKLLYVHDPILDLELVKIKWSNGSSKKVNVTGDSGTAMIRDIMRAID